MARNDSGAAPSSENPDSQPLTSWLDRRTSLQAGAARRVTPIGRGFGLARTFVRVSRDLGVRRAVGMSVDTVIARVGVRR